MFMTNSFCKVKIFFRFGYYDFRVNQDSYIEVYGKQLEKRNQIFIEFYGENI